MAIVRAAAALAALIVGVCGATAQELQVQKAQVAVTCSLTVGGRFEAKSTAVTGRVVPAQGAEDVQGSFAVDLRTLDTGIALRNAHLKETYLEVRRGEGFQSAVLDRIKLIGADASRAQGRVPFRGMFMLHGQVQEVQGTADITRDGHGVRVKVQFPLQLDAFQIPKPRYLGVGVGNEIRVEVTATLTSASATSS